MSPQNNQVKLSAASLADTPSLVAIFVDAFRHDTHTALKIASQAPGTQEQAMTDGLKYWLNNKNCLVLTATLGTSTVGWACWSWRNIDDIPSFEEKMPEDLLCRSIHTAIPERETITTEPLEYAVRPSHSDKPGIELLEDITNENMSLWQDTKFCPTKDTKCMTLVAIAVDSKFQGQGIGSALVGWGLDQADELGIFAWVSSSQSGWIAFERLGFQLCGGLKANLDDFADGIENGDDKWGEYVWRFGKRLPTFTPMRRNVSDCKT